MNVHEKFPLRGQIKKTPQTNRPHYSLMLFTGFFIQILTNHNPWRAEIF